MGLVFAWSKALATGMPAAFTRLKVRFRLCPRSESETIRSRFWNVTWTPTTSLYSHHREGGVANRIRRTQERFGRGKRRSGPREKCIATKPMSTRVSGRQKSIIPSLRSTTRPHKAVNLKSGFSAMLIVAALSGEAVAAGAKSRAPQAFAASHRVVLCIGAIKALIAVASARDQLSRFQLGQLILHRLKRETAQAGPAPAHTAPALGS